MRRKPGHRVVGLVGLLLACCVAPLAAQSVDRAVKEQLDFGVRMAQRGLWSEALFRFQRAAELDPERATVHNNLAVAYEALGLFDEALEQYREGLRLAPADRGLKRNYSRFVEFYKRYKPEKVGDEEAAAATAEGDDAEGKKKAKDGKPGSGPGRTAS